jgi:hypothetical protein
MAVRHTIGFIQARLEYSRFDRASQGAASQEGERANRFFSEERISTQIKSTCESYGELMHEQLC